MFLVATALESAEIGTMIGRNEAIQKRDFAGCVSAEVSLKALDSVGTALRRQDGSSFVIPALSVNLEDCMAFYGRPRPQSQEQVAEYVEGFTGVALTAAEFYAQRLARVDCDRGYAVLGAISYLRGLVTPIAREISMSDGLFEVPETVVDLAVCRKEGA